LLRATWHHLAIVVAESGPLRHAYTRAPPPPPPFPAQTTRKLTMEVAATSQMHLCNTICKCFLAKISIWLCTVAFWWLKMIFLRGGEVQTPSIFFVHHFVLRTVADTLADLFRLTSADSTAKPRGGVSSSAVVCSVAVIEVHEPKLLSFGLNFTPATYRRTDFRCPVQDSVFFCLLSHKYVHAVCVWPM
jgi:hypothetical protein